MLWARCLIGSSVGAVSEVFLNGACSQNIFSNSPRSPVAKRINYGTSQVPFWGVSGPSAGLKRLFSTVAS